MTLKRKRPVVGVIGYGRFGRLAARFIARRAEVIAYDEVKARLPARRAHIRAGTLAEAASCPVVLLAVPVSALRATVRRIRNLVRPGSLVIDVCAVKTLPVRWMKSALPLQTGIIGTHPLFGPDTVGRSLRGHRIVLCPVRTTRAQSRLILDRLQQSGLEVMVMTPELHDRMIAETVFLTQYVGRWVKAARTRRWPHATATYDRLLEVVRVAERDTDELFLDMWHFNPHARALARRLERVSTRLAHSRPPRRP